MEHSHQELNRVQEVNVTYKKNTWPILNTYLPPVIVFMLFMLFWQFGTQLLQIPPYLLPKPMDIVEAAVMNWSNLSGAVIRTITESMLGFMFSVIGGVVGALLMSSSKLLERSLYPYAILLQTIPIVAIAPIIVIWFGSGMNAIVIIAFTIGFFLCYPTRSLA